MIFSADDTIAAIATPPGIGGIGVLRISGEKAFQLVSPFFFRKREDQTAIDIEKDLPARQFIHGYIKDPEQNYVIDEVLLVTMPAPHSYTRENIVEIQAHGSSVGLYKMLERILSKGARLAEAGEFTKRAFLNGRIDLSQAEAVQELISAQTVEAAALASSQMTGVLSEQIRSLRQALLSICAKLEAEIDFPEDVEENTEEEFLPRLKIIGEEIQKLLISYEEAKSWRQELRIVLVGAPNVGKSSLLNKLLKTPKAIVTDVPGTTRDAIEGTVWMQGLPLTITDTAGIRTTDDIVEGLGIAKTMEAIEKSDLVLFITEKDPTEETKELRDLFSKTTKEKFWVQNKRDLLDDSTKTTASFLISAKTGEGLLVLQEKITSIREKQGGTKRPTVAPGLRHKALLEDANAAFERARQQLSEKAPRDMVLADLRLGMEALDRILGLSYDGDLLDEVFSQFCIGK